MHITSRSFLRNCQSILTPAPESRRDKLCFICFPWIVGTEELLGLPSEPPHHQLMLKEWHGAWHGLLAVSWVMGNVFSSLGSVIEWSSSNRISFVSGFTDFSFGPASTSEERIYSSTGQSWDFLNLYWTIKGPIDLCLSTLQLPGATETFLVMGYWGLSAVIWGINCMPLPHLSTEDFNNFMVGQDVIGVTRFPDSSETVELRYWQPISTTAWSYLDD